MKLIVGLGNPGTEYAGTRHNAGFLVVDRLARRHAIVGNRQRFHAVVAEARIRGQAVLLMQPSTFMNRSGQAVAEAARFYKLPPGDLMVVVDETALPLGSIRLRASGSPGGHNGLADIERALGRDDYPRLRIGIGAPILNDHPVPQVDYVLGRFTDTESRQLAPALDRACDALECWLDEGIDPAMTRFNRKNTPPADAPANDSTES